MYKSIIEAPFIKGYARMAQEGYLKGWHERNGGNLTYRIKKEEIEEVTAFLDLSKEFVPIGATVKNLRNEYFLVSGSGKYFSNIQCATEENVAIIEIDDSGENYRIVWGLVNGGKPTSELPAHLMNHSVKKEAINGEHRVIYHAHPVNSIAITFVFPLESKVISHLLWEMMTECPIIFPQGVGVVPWMVPGGEKIAIASSELMKKYDAIIWAHHGVFCSGTDFDLTFGLMDTIEKAAEILVKVQSMGGIKQTISNDGFRELGKAFNVTINPDYLD
ncbi:MAG: rhamnulose-1-phosphate aldolase [Clostridia bacterium]|nr:rhamnulose-1-phosphate aldolase [Clostridia bacterium]